MNAFKMVDDRRNVVNNRIPLSPKIRFNILRRDGFTCQYCGRIGTEKELEIDHIVPYSKGGTNDLGNLQVACRDCNRGKMADEIVNNDTDVKFVEKIVYKEIPVEKIVYIKDINVHDKHEDFEKKICDLISTDSMLIKKSKECEKSKDFGGAVVYSTMALDQVKELSKNTSFNQIDIDKLTHACKMEFALTYKRFEGSMDYLLDFGGKISELAKCSKRCYQLLNNEGLLS